MRRSSPTSTTSCTRAPRHEAAHVEMEGFGAFREPTAVDFADVDLMALVGSTGSGKSTVIDAVTFALYGSVARYDDNRLVAPVIHQLCPEARIRLSFELGGRTYAATRVVRRTKNGATTKEARLELGEEVLAGAAGEMGDAVQGLLGMDFDQFTKTVILPQGEFAAFLHDAPSDRQKLLQKLLGFGVYARMGQEARLRAAAAGSQLELLAEQLEGADEVSNERLAASGGPGRGAGRPAGQGPDRAGGARQTGRRGRGGRGDPRRARPAARRSGEAGRARGGRLARRRPDRGRAGARRGDPRRGGGPHRPRRRPGGGQAGSRRQGLRASPRAHRRAHPPVVVDRGARAAGGEREGRAGRRRARARLGPRGRDRDRPAPRAGPAGGRRDRAPLVAGRRRALPGVRAGGGRDPAHDVDAELEQAEQAAATAGDQARTCQAAQATAAQEHADARAARTAAAERVRELDEQLEGAPDEATLRADLAEAERLAAALAEAATAADASDQAERTARRALEELRETRVVAAARLLDRPRRGAGDPDAPGRPPRVAPPRLGGARRLGPHNDHGGGGGTDRGRSGAGGDDRRARREASGANRAVQAPRRGRAAGRPARPRRRAPPPGGDRHGDGAHPARAARPRRGRRRPSCRPSSRWPGSWGSC